MNLEKKQQSQQLFFTDLKEFANVKSVGGLYGNVIVTDNSTVIATNNISNVMENVGKDEIIENDIIQGIYSNHAHLINNLGSLFETMWSEKELLTSILSVKKHLIEANKQIIKHTEQTEHISVYQDMINITAHEIQTPIHVILGFVEIALANNLYKHFDDRNGNYLQIIKNNAIRLQKLVEQTLDLARIERNDLVLHKVHCNIYDEIQNIINEFHNKKPVNRRYKKTIDSESKHVKILFTGSQTNIFVNIDILRIYQVVSNLINNAINSIESSCDSKIEHGSIIISIKLTQDPNLDHIIVKSSSKGYDSGISESNHNNDYNFNSNVFNSLHEQQIAKPYVIVSVKDSGKGFPEEILSKIFTKFNSFSGKGLGIGLYISKKIIEAHGGKIWAHNIVNCSNDTTNHKEIYGAIVSFNLPIE